MSRWLTFFQLIKREMHVFRYQIVGKIIDLICMMLTLLVIFGYLMPKLGLENHYGVFMLFGSLVSFGFFDMVGQIGTLMADMEGERRISYLLTLPIPSWMVFSYFSVCWAIKSFLLAIILLPVGKLLLFHQFYFKDFHLFSFLLILIFANVFFGYFALWVASVLSGVQDIGRIWFRVINPIFMFGGFFYPWHVLYQASPFFGILDLINPFLYVMEGARSVVATNIGTFIPTWICLLVLAGFTLIFAFDGIRRLRIRLDCI